MEKPTDEELRQYSEFMDRQGRMDLEKCKGCGLCAASCPQLTIDMLHFRDLQIEASICAAV